MEDSPDEESSGSMTGHVKCSYFDPKAKDYLTESILLEIDEDEGLLKCYLDRETIKNENKLLHSIQIVKLDITIPKSRDNLAQTFALKSSDSANLLLEFSCPSRLSKVQWVKFFNMAKTSMKEKSKNKSPNDSSNDGEPKTSDNFSKFNALLGVNLSKNSKPHNSKSPNSDFSSFRLNKASPEQTSKRSLTSNLSNEKINNPTFSRQESEYNLNASMNQIETQNNIEDDSDSSQEYDIDETIKELPEYYVEENINEIVTQVDSPVVVNRNSIVEQRNSLRASKILDSPPQINESPKSENRRSSRRISIATLGNPENLYSEAQDLTQLNFNNSEQKRESSPMSNVSVSSNPYIDSPITSNWGENLMKQRPSLNVNSDDFKSLSYSQSGYSIITDKPIMSASQLFFASMEKDSQFKNIVTSSNSQSNHPQPIVPPVVLKLMKRKTSCPIESQGRFAESVSRPAKASHSEPLNEKKPQWIPGNYGNNSIASNKVVPAKTMAVRASSNIKTERQQSPKVSNKLPPKNNEIESDQCILGDSSYKESVSNEQKSIRESPDTFASRRSPSLPRQTETTRMREQHVADRYDISRSSPSEPKSKPREGTTYYQNRKGDNSRSSSPRSETCKSPDLGKEEFIPSEIDMNVKSSEEDLYNVYDRNENSNSDGPYEYHSAPTRTTPPVGPSYAAPRGVTITRGKELGSGSRSTYINNSRNASPVKASYVTPSKQRSFSQPKLLSKSAPSKLPTAKSPLKKGATPKFNVRKVESTQNIDDISSARRTVDSMKRSMVSPTRTQNFTKYNSTSQPTTKVSPNIDTWIRPKTEDNHLRSSTPRSQISDLTYSRPPSAFTSPQKELGRYYRSKARMELVPPHESFVDVLEKRVRSMSPGGLGFRVSKSNETSRIDDIVRQELANFEMRMTQRLNSAAPILEDRTIASKQAQAQRNTSTSGFNFSVNGGHSLSSRPSDGRGQLNRSPSAINHILREKRSDHVTEEQTTEAAEWHRLSNWLFSTGMGKYAKIFKSHGITKLSVVELLRRDDLEEIMVDENDITNMLHNIAEFSNQTKEFSEKAMTDSSSGGEVRERRALSTSNALGAQDSDSPSKSVASILSKRLNESILKVLSTSQYDTGSSDALDENQKICNSYNKILGPSLQSIPLPITRNRASIRSRKSSNGSEDECGSDLDEVNRRRLSSTDTITSARSVTLDYGAIYNQPNEHFYESPQPVDEVTAEKSSLSPKEVISRLLAFFDSGDVKVFFDLWGQAKLSSGYVTMNYLQARKNTNASVFQSPAFEATISMEFYVLLYFTVYGTVISQPIEARRFAINIFKSFIEALSADAASSSSPPQLLKTNDFGIYSGVVFVPNPKDNPTYAHLFKEEWRLSLRLRLEKYLSVMLSNSESPGPLRRGSSVKETILQFNLQSAQPNSLGSLKRSSPRSPLVLTNSESVNAKNAKFFPEKSPLDQSRVNEAPSAQLISAVPEVSSSVKTNLSISTETKNTKLTITASLSALPPTRKRGNSSTSTPKSQVSPRPGIQTSFSFTNAQSTSIPSKVSEPVPEVEGGIVESSEPRQTSSTAINPEPTVAIVENMHSVSDRDPRPLNLNAPTMTSEESKLMQPVNMNAVPLKEKHQEGITLKSNILDSRQQGFASSMPAAAHPSISESSTSRRNSLPSKLPSSVRSVSSKNKGASKKPLSIKEQMAAYKRELKRQSLPVPLDGKGVNITEDSIRTTESLDSLDDVLPINSSWPDGNIPGLSVEELM